MAAAGSAAKAALWLAAGLAAAGYVYALRCLQAAWRPRRWVPRGIDLACVGLVLLPGSVSRVAPAQSAVLGAVSLGVFLAFFAAAEAFSAKDRGFRSPRAFAGVVAVTVLALVMGRAGLRWAAWRSGAARFDLGPVEGGPALYSRMPDVLLLLGVPVLASWDVSGLSRRRRRFRHACALAGVAGIVFGYSRAAWVALTVEMAVLSVRIPKARAWVWPAVAAACAAAFLPAVRQRTGTLVRLDHSTNVQRLHDWAAAYRCLLRSPVAGHGLGTFTKVCAEPRAGLSGAPCPHNLYLHVAVECGVPALAVFAAWMWRVIGLLRKRAAGLGPESPVRAMCTAGLAAVAGLLTFGLFDL